MPPAGLAVVERSPVSLRLAWSGPSSAIRYEVSRQTAECDSFAPLASVPATTEGPADFVDSDLTPRTRYQYRVRSIAARGHSSWSDTVSATTGLPAPRLISALPRSPLEAVVIWEAGSTRGEIEVQRRQSRSDWHRAGWVPSGGTEFVDRFAQSFIDLDYRVREFDAGDSSAFSEQKRVHLDRYSSGPAGTLERLREAYQDRDPLLLGTLLSEDFAFRFDRGDLESHPDWAWSWDRSAESEFVQRLFDLPHLSSIELSFEPELPPSDPGSPTTARALLHEVGLRIRVEEGGIEQNLFALERGASDLRMRDTGTTWEGGLPRWEITQWKDLRGETQPPTSPTWGAIRQTVSPKTLELDGPWLRLPPGKSDLDASETPSDCGEFQVGGDGTYESGYAWQGSGVVSPEFGAFAQWIPEARGWICAVTVDLTAAAEGPVAEAIDLFVWADAGGVPGQVLGVTTIWPQGEIPRWPAVRRHRGEFGLLADDRGVWVGVRSFTPGSPAEFFVAADLDGISGSGPGPMTNVAPGLGYPSGWQSVSSVFGPTVALGIGCSAGGEPIDSGRPRD
ncbi:MAG: fibronectin type III domain-containing protein [Candidatus Eisenbacteria bacterium]|nr:fibronectin type III domain-containing protein [Candidatus Eisenbacteria bacterium]